MFGPSETTTGGNALKFYSSVRIDIRPSTAIKKNDTMLGKLTKVKVTKNKVAPPFRRCEFDIMFGEGISRTGEIIDLGVQLDIIKKSGSWFSYDGSKLAQGRDAAKDVLRDNPELADELEQKIMAALHGIEQSGAALPAKPSKDNSKTADKDEDVEPELDDDFSDLDDEFSVDENI